jgi:hypothetical protein
MISRRALLRGAGCMIGLPLLEAMEPSIARAQGMTPKPRRLLFWYVPDGIHMPNWTPTMDGAGFQLPPILSPLASSDATQDLSLDITVLTGMRNLPARPDGPGDHASGTGAFLTAMHPFKTEAANISDGISVDQVAANSIGRYTRFPSLQIGTDGGDSVGNCDSGYSCAYAHNISWSAPDTPLAKEVNAGSLFDRLFGGNDPMATAEQKRKRKLYRLSILDFVKDDVSRLQAKLGRTDNRKMDEYLAGIRQLENQINTNVMGPTCAPPMRPTDSSDIIVQTQIMADLMVLAFQCDLTRTITFMHQNAGDNTTFGFLGMTDGHHTISHHMGLQSNFDKLTVIDTWEIQMLAYMLRKMKAIQEPDGTLLDNSLVFFSSEISDGNAHNHDDLPVLLAGKAGGMLTSGRHITYANGGAPIANLFISMLSTVGVQVPSFGADSTGPLDSFI